MDESLIKTIIICTNTILYLLLNYYLFLDSLKNVRGNFRITKKKTFEILEKAIGLWNKLYYKVFKRGIVVNVLFV